MIKVSVGWMYPDLLNLHGERASVQMLNRVGNAMGISVEILKLSDPKAPIPFEELDLLIFLPGEITAFRTIIPVLKANDGFRSYVEKGGYILAIGTTGVLFGRQITRLDGSVVEGLGILDLTATEREYVWGNDLHLRMNDTKQELVGSQIQMVNVDAKQPLAQVLYGMGNHNSGTDGARYKNVMFTNCLGPLFVKNPWFAEEILKDICLKKYLGIEKAQGGGLADHSFDATLKWISSKPSQPNN